MKKTVIVTKAGMVFRTRSTAQRASALGEQGETEGLLRHLLEKDEYCVVYFGRYEGEVLPGLTVVEPDLDGLSDSSLASEQEEHWQHDYAAIEAALGSSEPLCMLEICGMANAVSWIGNTNFVNPQACAVRYTGPQMAVLNHFNLKRVSVNNDLRNYPKNFEMTMGWEACRPIALLDQMDSTISRVVNGVRFVRRGVWAKPESWSYLPAAKPRERNVPVSVIAHCHMKDGFRQPDRAECFDAILSPGLDVAGLFDRGMRVYGKGWEHYHLYGSLPELFAGPITPSDVGEVLAGTLCCPCVPPGAGYYTNKMYVCVAQGCVPLLYGDGSHRLTYDVLGVYAPLDSSNRVVRPGDLARRARELSDPWRYELEIASWREMLQPDFSTIDALLGELADGADVNGDEWWEKYGGYRRIS